MIKQRARTGNSPVELNYCFVLGCSGSGKTLLAEALHRLDGTLFAREHILPTFLAHLVNQPLDPSVRGVLERGVAHHFATYATAGDHFSRFDAILQFLHRQLSAAELTRALTGKRRYDLFLMESNFFSLAPEFLERVAPEARWIFIVRDGRDCADQLERNYQILTDEKLAALSSNEMPIGRKVDHRFVPWWVEAGSEHEFLAASPFGRAIWMWKAIVRRCHDFYSERDLVSQDRAFVIRYRELVTDPDEAGRRLSNWLGKPLTRAARRQFRTFHSGLMGGYKSRPRAELEEAERIARAELQLFSYL